MIQSTWLSLSSGYTGIYIQYCCACGNLIDSILADDIEISSLERFKDSFSSGGVDAFANNGQWLVGFQEQRLPR